MNSNGLPWGSAAPLTKGGPSHGILDRGGNHGLHSSRRTSENEAAHVALKHVPTRWRALAAGLPGRGGDQSRVQVL